MDVVQAIPRDVLRVKPQERHCERIFERIVEIPVPRFGEGIVEVAQITLPEVLKVTPQEQTFERIFEWLLKCFCLRLGKRSET